MKITRRSHLTGKVHTMDLPVTGEQLIHVEQGEVIQSVLGHLTPGQREFVMTGITDDEWEAVFGPEEDDR